MSRWSNHACYETPMVSEELVILRICTLTHTHTNSCQSCKSLVIIIRRRCKSWHASDAGTWKIWTAFFFGWLCFEALINKIHCAQCWVFTKSPVFFHNFVLKNRKLTCHFQPTHEKVFFLGLSLLWLSLLELL